MPGGVSNEYQVWSIPTLALFHNGELMAQQVGVPGGASVEQGLRDWVKNELARLDLKDGDDSSDVIE